MIRNGSPAGFTLVTALVLPVLPFLVLAAPASAYSVREDMSQLDSQKTVIAKAPGASTAAAVDTTIKHQVFFEDFEGSTAGWSVFNWRAAQSVAWSNTTGTQSCTDTAWWCGQANIAPGRDGYGNGWIMTLTTNKPGGINISGLNTARLTFKNRVRTELDFDFAWILIKGGNAGARWYVLANYSGDLGASCSNTTIDIPDSFKTVTQPVTLQFLFGSDQSISAEDSSGTFTGWSIDDVKIAGTGGQQNDVRFFDTCGTATQWIKASPNPGSLWHLVDGPDPLSTCTFLSTHVFLPTDGSNLVPDWVDTMLISPPMDLQGVFTNPIATSNKLELEFDEWINLPPQNPVFWSLWISGSSDQTTWTPWKNALAGLIIQGGNPECIYASANRIANNRDFYPYVTSQTGIAPGTRYIRLGFRLRSEAATTFTEDVIGPERLGILTDGVWYDNVAVYHSYTISAVETVSGVPLAPRPTLLRAFPNPLNPYTTLEFSTPRSGPVAIRIFDTRGRAVATIVDESMGPGVYRARWDGKDRSGVAVASGLYVAEIQGPSGRDTKRLTVLK